MNAGFACMLCVVISAWPRAVADDLEADQLNARLLDAHNKVRVDAKLPPLTLDPKLTEAARRHAVDMAEREEMSHEGSDGSTPEDRVKRAAYHYLRTAENVAWGQESVDQVLEAWMESPGHKANILGDFAQMGAARGISDDGTSYWCVDFGTPIPRLDPIKAASEVVEKLNAARKEAGVDPLKADKKLAAVALKMAKAAAEADSVHPEKAERPETQELPDLVKLIKETGVRYSNLGQSMASGNPTADDVVKWLLKQASQKEMLLGPFKSVGIGYASGADYRPYWCVLLVEP